MIYGNKKISTLQHFKPLTILHSGLSDCCQMSKKLPPASRPNHVWWVRVNFANYGSGKPNKTTISIQFKEKAKGKANKSTDRTGLIISDDSSYIRKQCRNTNMFSLTSQWPSFVLLFCLMADSCGKRIVQNCGLRAFRAFVGKIEFPIIITGMIDSSIVN